MGVAWLFPGQGSQVVGMGRDLYEASPAARRVLDLADQTLGVALTQLLFEGPAATLQLTINAQPAIVAVSLAALAAYREACGPAPDRALWPDFVAGHSVGEYAALVAAGAADEATGLRLVRERARLMHQAGQARPGSMMAILGLELAAVEEACRRARAQIPSSYVWVANHNLPAQVAIAGDPEGLALASKLCQEAGARRCVPLAVSAAFHSAAMEPVVAPLAAVLAAATIGDARVPLVANVSARPIQRAAALREELAQQVARPVRWADSLQFLLDQGVRTFIEFGAGQVLTSMVQRLPAPDGELRALAVGDVPSAAHAAALFAT